MARSYDIRYALTRARMHALFAFVCEYTKRERISGVDALQISVRVSMKNSNMADGGVAQQA